MTLTANKPDQQVIDGALLDAAWQHARLLEGELTMARYKVKHNHENFTRELGRRLKLESAIGGLMTRLKGNPDTPVDSIVDELSRLINEEQ
jgi:hypothetical protein